MNEKIMLGKLFWVARFSFSLPSSVAVVQWTSIEDLVSHLILATGRTTLCLIASRFFSKGIMMFGVSASLWLPKSPD